MPVYLLHFDRPISPNHTAQYYLGTTRRRLCNRIKQHRERHGARLCEVAAERGIGFVVARVWKRGRKVERQLKNRHNGRLLCPICNGTLAALFPGDQEETEFWR